MHPPREDLGNNWKDNSLHSHTSSTSPAPEVNPECLVGVVLLHSAAERDLPS